MKGIIFVPLKVFNCFAIKIVTQEIKVYVRILPTNKIMAWRCSSRDATLHAKEHTYVHVIILIVTIVATHLILLSERNFRQNIDIWNVNTALCLKTHCIMKDLSELLQKLKLDAEQTKTLDFNVADSIITALQSKEGKAFLFPPFTFLFHGS